jgi:hypothetical protein
MGKGKGEGQRRCVFCCSAPVTREHILPQSWRDRVGFPAVPREFIQRRKGNESTQRTESPKLFDVVVRRVCKKCNEGWMQALDKQVAHCVLNPDDTTQTCDPTQFRRWAIKVATMRSTLDYPGVIPKRDCTRLYAGEDVDQWRIFIGRVNHPHLRDAFAIAGGRVIDGELTQGIIQISWCVGTTLVVCLREGPVTENLLSKAFTDFCRGNGNHFAEVLPNAVEMPSLFSLIPLPIHQIQFYFWYFSTDIASPVRDAMMKIENLD